MKQSRLTGAIALTIAQAVVLMLGYVTHLWIGRVLGPAPYGIYGVVLAVQTIYGMILTLGIPIAVSRFVAQDEEHAQSILRQALRIQGTIGLLVAALALVTAPILAAILGDRNLTSFIAFVAAVLFFQAFYPIYTQYLSGAHRFNRQAALTSIYAVAKLVGAISLIYVFGVYGAFAGFAIGGIIAGIVGWYWTRGPSVTGKHLPLRAFLSFAGTYVLILVGLQILISLDLFMVKAFLKNDTLAGLYNAAVTLSRISYMLLQGLAFVLLPSVSKLTASDEDRSDAVIFIRDTIRYLIALIVPSVTFAAVTSENLIVLFYSHEYAPAAPALTILMIGLGSLAFYVLMANIVAGAGKAMVPLKVTGIMLAISALAGALLIPQFGLVGAATQTTIAGVVGLLILAAYTFKTFQIPIPLKSTLNILVATAAAILPTYVWEVHPLMLPLQYGVLFIIYIAALGVLKEITPGDRERLARVHPKLAWIAPRS